MPDEPMPEDPASGDIEVPDPAGEPRDATGVVGRVSWVLTGPDGKVKRRGTSYNTITQVGDQRLGEAAAGVAGAPAAPTGMKLGTGTTAPAKTGAGAAIVTYVANSNQAIGTPTSALNGVLRRITYTATFAAGKATTAGTITEVALVNDAIATDATSTAANTLSRALLTGLGSKGAADSLALTYTWDVGT
jgi:hypothetical protein